MCCYIWQHVKQQVGSFISSAAASPSCDLHVYMVTMFTGSLVSESSLHGDCSFTQQQQSCLDRGRFTNATAGASVTVCRSQPSRQRRVPQCSCGEQEPRVSVILSRYLVGENLLHFKSTRIVRLNTLKTVSLHLPFWSQILSYYLHLRFVLLTVY